MQKIDGLVYFLPVQALYWLDDRVRQHSWLALGLLSLSAVVTAWKYLQARDARFRQMVRNEVESVLTSHAFVQRFVGPELAQEWIDDRARMLASMEERYRDFETTFTEEMHRALRDMVVSARSQGIPLQIQVGSTREADILREALGGSIPVNVSRRGVRPQTPRPTDPNTPSPSAPTQWDRLLADEESEIPCPTTTATETPTPLPPKKKPRKKT